MDIKRNDPCPCGSGKKYKNCCGLKQAKEHAKELNRLRKITKADAKNFSTNPIMALRQRVMHILESEEQIVPPDYIPESHASTKEAETPTLPPPDKLKSLS